MTSHDMIRATIAKYGMTETELVRATASEGRIPEEDAKRMVDRVLGGGPVTTVLALAVCRLVVNHEKASRH